MRFETFPRIKAELHDNLAFGAAYNVDKGELGYADRINKVG